MFININVYINDIYIAGTCKRYDGLWFGINVKKSKCL